MRRVLLLVLLAAACGQRERAAAPPSPPIAVPSSVEATPAGDEDPVVARVDGRPVYGSCVQRQAEHLGVGRDEALRQCVDFELLAGAADARGLRGDPEVAATWRREIVRTIIDRDLGTLRGVADLPAEFVDPLLAQAQARLHRPYMRVSYYARFPVPTSGALDSPEERRAQAAAEELAAQFANDDAVLWEPFHAAAKRIAAAHGTPVDTQGPYQAPIVELEHVRGAEKLFRDALRDIPALGRISPAVRARDGWFVILWWSEVPEADLTDAFFDAARLEYFTYWTDRIGDALGMSRWIDEDRLAALAEDTP